MFIINEPRIAEKKKKGKKRVMTALKIRDGTSAVLALLPCRLGREIETLLRSRRGGIGSVREIRIRAHGRSTILIGRDSIPLYTQVSREDLSETVYRLAEKSVYAYEDSIRSGYITVGCGIRIGVCGEARYDGAHVGIGEITSLVCRIPTGECEFSDRLFEIWDMTQKLDTGMLIYSPPGVGKTTALRALAGYIGGGRDARRVVIVDERGEFLAEDYASCEVDILRGYRRELGTDIAIRTMSPDVLIIDEIGEGDAARMCSAVRCGIPVIASAHAATLAEISSRHSFADILSSGAFGVLVGITRTSDGYSLAVDGV